MNTASWIVFGLLAAAFVFAVGRVLKKKGAMV